MHFARDLGNRLLEAARHFKVVVLTGARQTGKTTLLKDQLPQYHYVSLDLPQDAALAEQAPDEFLARHPPPLIVDEVQYAPGLFRHLKVVVDRARGRGRFILTGSQRFELMRTVSESLAGRAAILELHGLSCAELGPALPRALQRRRLDSILARGFFPALWADPGLPRADFFRSYVATWLERDLRLLLDVGSLRDFERFLRACAARSAQLLNKSELARDVGIAVSTAGQWLSALEAAGQIVLLEPWFANATKRLVKTPKLYLTDVGLMTFLLGLDEAALGNWAGRGALWETLVLGELLKWRATRRPEASLWFFRDKDGAEVDFVVQAGGVATVIDAKLAELPDRGDAAYLAAVAKKLGERLGGVLLATPTLRAPFPMGPARVVSGFQLRELLG